MPRNAMFYKPTRSLPVTSSRTSVLYPGPRKEIYKVPVIGFGRLKVSVADCLILFFGFSVNHHPHKPDLRRKLLEVGDENFF